MLSAALKAFRQFLTTTSLHGFKYLDSQNGIDRAAWAICCAGGAGCAGALCAVLWARFQLAPALLQLRREDAAALPAAGFCYPSALLATRILTAIGYNGSLPLVTSLTQLLNGRKPTRNNLSILELYLKLSNTTLPEALILYSPQCSEIVARCMVNLHEVGCNAMIHKDVSLFGACCSMRPSYMEQIGIPANKISEVDFILNYTSDPTFPGYDLIIRHEGSGWLRWSTLTAGFLYISTVSFRAIQGSTDETLGERSCEVNENYSRTACLRECVETICGCSDPMLSHHDTTHGLLPYCSLARLSCLRHYKIGINSCNCLYPCKTVTKFVSLRQSELNAIACTVDPIFSGMDPKTSTALKIAVNTVGSHVFARIPTESWLTLLSSLGGVFNMFLGVSLCSALELLHLAAVRLPRALRLRPTR